MYLGYFNLSLYLSLMASDNSFSTCLIFFWYLSFSPRNILHSSINLVFWLNIVLILSSLIDFNLSDVTLIKYSFFVIHCPYLNNSSFSSLGLSYFNLMISLISLLVIYFLCAIDSISSFSSFGYSINCLNLWAIRLGGSLLLIMDSNVYYMNWLHTLS